MAAANGQNSSHRSDVKSTKPEGSKKHIVAFVFSILLTFIAFAVVMAGEINTDFTYIMLVGLAIIQVFVQMAFWMHMKDKGHTFAIIAILSGVVVVFTCVIMALFWTTW